MIPVFRMAVLATFCAATPILHAQPSVVVTLASVGDRVRAQNPHVQAARLRIREAVGRARQAGKLANPELSTTWGQDRHFRERQFELSFSQRFPITARLQQEREISATAIRAAEAEVRQVEWTIVSQARLSAVRILALREQRALLEKQHTLAVEFATLLGELASRGEGSRLDASQARLEANGLTLELKRIEAEETALLGELKPLLGMKSGEPLVVSGSLPQPSLPGNSVDPSKRADFQLAQLAAHAAGQETTLEKMKRYEDVEGGIFLSGERREDAPVGYRNEMMFGLSLKIPLPLRDRNEGAIEAAEAREERKYRETEALAADIRLEAEAAREEMRQWLEMLREVEQSLLPLAEEQVELAETTYQSGQGEIQAVLRSREKRLELAASRLTALREYHLARVRYDAALGTP